MKDKHTTNLILISSKWLIPSFGVCSWGINSSSKCFHLFFSGVQISSVISSEPPFKSSQGLNLYSFILHFYLIILLSPEFFMVVLHDLIHSSRVHQDLVGEIQVSFLLASRSVINSPCSFEVEFCISSFFSAIQSFLFVAGYQLMILRCYHKSTKSLFFSLLIFSTTPFNPSF